MQSLWNILPIEIQEYIQEISSASLIQEIFKKNREWYFLRIKSMKNIRPSYDGKGYRVSDRVLLRQDCNKVSYGTISSISYEYGYCWVNLLDNKKQYFYPEKIEKNKKLDGDILQIILLKAWNFCLCHKLNYKCNYCLVN